MTIQNIEEIGSMMPLKVKALTSGETDDHIKASGKIIKCTVKAF